MVRLATGSAAYTALNHYTAELSALEQELSMSSRLVAVTDELSKLAEDCDEPARGDEPYRRALRVIHGRLTATAGQILDEEPDNLLDLGLPPYSTPGEMLADLDTVDASLRATAARCWPTIGWRSCGKPCTSSGFTSPAWICGRTPTSTKKWSPSYSPGPECIPTIAR